jgi:hypothetical protein
MNFQNWFSQAGGNWLQYTSEYKGEMANAYKILVGKYEGKGPLGRPKHRGEDNIKM